MDIYRFFHPHHNPRLHSTPVRQQELSELEQAASELRKSLERARLRTERAPADKILPAHFDDITKAIRFVEASLQTLCDAHEGDDELALDNLIKERSALSGWEAWTALVREQLGRDGEEDTPVAQAEATQSSRHRFIPSQRETVRVRKSQPPLPARKRFAS